MPIIATEGDSKVFQPAPAGLHQAVCVDVVDMGILKVTYAGNEKEQHKIRIVWQLDQLMENGKRFIVQKRYTCSLNPKARLRQELESWRGRLFNFEELAGFDLEKLIGANAQLNIQHVEKDGKVYANVVTIVPLGRGMTKLEPVDYIRVQDRTDEQPQEAPELTMEDVPF